MLSKLAYEFQWLIYADSMEYMNNLQSFLRFTKFLGTLQFLNSPSQACSLSTFLPLFNVFPLLLISRYLVGLGIGKGGQNSRLTDSNPTTITLICCQVVSNASLKYFSCFYPLFTPQMLLTWLSPSTISPGLD